MYPLTRRPSDVKILYQVIWRFPRKHPMLPIKNCVGVPRIELGLSAPKADVLPIYYTPTQFLIPKQTYYRYITRYNIFCIRSEITNSVFVFLSLI